MVKYPGYFSDDDGEFVQVPYKWEICSHCRGDGGSSAYLGSFTWEELNEEGPEFISDYFSGVYDRECECCGGSGKVAAPDHDKMTEEQEKKYHEYMQAEIEYESERRAEMRYFYGSDR